MSKREVAGSKMLPSDGVLGGNTPSDGSIARLVGSGECRNNRHGHSTPPGSFRSLPCGRRFSEHWRCWQRAQGERWPKAQVEIRFRLHRPEPTTTRSRRANTPILRFHHNCHRVPCPAQAVMGKCPFRAVIRTLVSPTGCRRAECHRTRTVGRTAKHPLKAPASSAVDFSVADNVPAILAFGSTAATC